MGWYDGKGSVREKAYKSEDIAKYLEAEGDLRTSAAFYEEASQLYRGFNRVKSRNLLKAAARIWSGLASKMEMQRYIERYLDYLERSARGERMMRRSLQELNAGQPTSRSDNSYLGHR